MIGPKGLVLSTAIAIGCLHGCTTLKTSDKNIETVSYIQVVEMRASAEHGLVVLVDVRSTQRFVQGHIPDAVNIPLPDLVANDPRLSEADRIIVYAFGRDNDLSPAAAKKILALGYKNVYDFRGGLAEWEQHGGVVTPPAVSTAP